MTCDINFWITNCEAISEHIKK